MISLAESHEETGTAFISHLSYVKHCVFYWLYLIYLNTTPPVTIF